jgi:hypothetical protein
MATAGYSQVYYWNYVFTPIFVFLVLFSLYYLFTLSDPQAIDYNQLRQQAKVMINASRLTLNTK